MLHAIWKEVGVKRCPLTTSTGRAPVIPKNSEKCALILIVFLKMTVLSDNRGGSGSLR